MSRGALPGVDRLNGKQSLEYERRVDSFKDEARELMVGLMGEANPGREAWLLAAAGDQTWDLASAKVVGAMAPPQQLRLESGHHVMRLPGGGVGLKLDDGLVASGEGVEDVIERFKPRLLEALAARRTDRPGVAIIVFDVDDTLVRGTDDAPPIEPMVELYHQLLDRPRARDLAREWGLDYAGPNHHLVCFIVTARPYSLTDLDLLVRELLKAGIRLPPHPCSVLMRPGEMHETPHGPL